MQIRVATLNVWAIPGLARAVSDRMVAIGSRLPALDLDVLALQEVWTSDARRTLVAAGHRAGLVHAWHGDEPLGGGGLVVLSRLPLESVRFERFALRGHSRRVDHGEVLSGKGFVQIRLRTEAGPLTFVDTHLHARYTRDVTHEYRPHRAGQIVQLAMGLMHTHTPVVAAGDFNFRERDEGYTILTGLTSLRDVAAELSARQMTVFGDNPYRRPGRTSKRIDYVFARSGKTTGVRAVSCRRIFDEIFDLRGRGASCSNHAGVLAELELTSPGSRPRPPDPAALALAAKLLAEGRDDAARRRTSGRRFAAAGFGGALLATAGVRSPTLSRRRLLRGTLQGIGIAALTPGVFFSLLSEVFVPDELRAFDALREHLAGVAPGAGSDEEIA